MKTKISKFQYFCLLPNLLFAKAIGFTSGVLSRNIGSDNWTSMTIGFVVGTLVLLIMTFISSRFPEETIVQYSKKILGKIPSKLVGILLSLFFAIAYMTSANTVALHLKQYFLPRTPYIVLCAAYTILVMYGVYLGIEVVIRFSFFALFMVVLLNLGMILGTLNAFHFINLLPIFDKGVMKNITSSVYVFSDLAIAILGVGMIYPMLASKKKSMSVSLASMTLAALLIIMWPFMETGVMGADVMKQYVIVCMQQARSAQLTIYLPRYEFIMVVLFIWAAFVQSAVMFHSCLYSFKQAVGMKKDRIFFFVIAAVLAVGTSYTGFDHNRFTNLLAYPWPQVCAVLCIGLPVILLVAGGIRGKLAKDES